MRRVQQTFDTFTNWGPILARLGGGQYLSEAVTFRTRTGLAISCPNIAGARVPVYEIFAEDCYHLADFLGTSIGEPMRVVDIGAHIGTFACEFSRLAPRAEIHCFEPSPTTASYLRRNVAANAFDARVHVSQAAVTAEIGESRLLDNRGGSGLNRLAPRGGGSADGIAVPSTSFDALIDDIGPADFVKIDCEGGEYDLVFGSAPRSWQGVRRVVLEYHPHPGHRWSELRDWFGEQGLTTVNIEPSSADQGTAWLARTGVGAR